MTLFNRFLKDESGATAIEYALIAAIIGVGTHHDARPCSVTDITACSSESHDWTGRGPAA